MKAITLKEMKELCCKDKVLVNVLSQESFLKDHIPKSINIPHDRFDELAPLVLPDKEQHIVVYCANAACTASPEAAKKLDALGYANVYDLEGGMAEWTEMKAQCCKGEETDSCCSGKDKKEHTEEQSCCGKKDCGCEGEKNGED